MGVEFCVIVRASIRKNMIDFERNHMLIIMTQNLYVHVVYVRRPTIFVETCIS